MPNRDSAANRLEAWRAAEREAEGAAAGSARGEMARIVADRARELYHESEDAVRMGQGDRRPRSMALPPIRDDVDEAQSR